MQKQDTSINTVSTTDLKKDKDQERNHIFYYKRRSFIKKVLELAKQFDQEIFICLHDKKNNKVLQYSSDTDNFSLNNVVKLIQTYKKKTDKQVMALQSLESISDQLTDSQKDCLSEEGLSDATVDTKKSQDVSTEDKTENASQTKSIFDVSEKSNERFSLDMEVDKFRSESQSLFNLSSMYNDQDKKLSDLLCNEDLNNESSQPIMHTSNSMFPMVNSPLNKVSNMEDTLDNYDDEEVEKVEFIHQETNFDSMNLDNTLNCLRYNSRLGDKVNFAQKYLFKNAEETHDDDLSQESEHSEYSQDNDESIDQMSGAGCEGSMNDSDLSNPIELPISIESDKASSDELREPSENKTIKSQPVDSQDMFFSCCDWEVSRDKPETLVTDQEKPSEEFESPKNTQLENFSDSDEETSNQFQQCKRKSKLARKEGAAPSDDSNQFDIDSVMKKVYVPHETEKIISSKSYFSKHKRSDPKRKLILKKIQLKSEAVSPIIINEKQDNESNNLAAMDEDANICLSPLGSSNSKLFEFNHTVLQKN